MRHKIQPHERGHRAPFSASEPTEQYSIKVVQSLKQRLVSLGAVKVRKILESAVLAQETGPKK